MKVFGVKAQLDVRLERDYLGIIPFNASLVTQPHEKPVRLRLVRGNVVIEIQAVRLALVHANRGRYYARRVAVCRVAQRDDEPRSVRYRRGNQLAHRKPQRLLRLEVHHHRLVGVTPASHCHAHVGVRIHARELAVATRIRRAVRHFNEPHFRSDDRRRH